jgi:hypothetical protein
VNQKFLKFEKVKNIAKKKSKTAKAKAGYYKIELNGTAHIRHQCWKTTVLSCHRCLIKMGVEKMNNI